VATILFVLKAQPAKAAPPCDELLRLVPSDAGFVIVIQDVRGHFDRIGKSPFAKLCKATLPSKADAAELKQLAELDEMVKREIGTDLSKLRDDVIGDAVVLVWRPGPPDKTDADEGVVLVHPRDTKLAAGMFDHLDAAQTKSGQLKEKSTRTHASQSYKRRVRTDEPDEYQYQRGNVIAFGSSEAMLKQVIEADTADKNQKPPMADKLRALNVDGAAIAWWINPRAFDAALSHKQKSASGPEALVIHAITKHWQAFDGLAGFVQLGDDLRIGVAITGRPDAMPASTRMFFSEAAKPSSLIDSFPKDALLTISGRFSLPPLLDAGAEILPDAARKQFREVASKTIAAALGPDTAAALPSRLGPDWGVCVTAPPPESNSPLPVVTAAVRLDDSAGSAVVPRVLDGVNAVATMAAIGYNANHSEAIALRSERIGEIEVRYFVGDQTFPNGIRPAYAWTKGYLLFASTPDAIARFHIPSAAAVDGTAPLLRIAPSTWVSYLSTYKTALTGMLATQTGIPSEEANAHIDGTIQMLRLFNSIEVAIQSGNNKAAIELKIVPAAALR
jgi:hypothetical protein